MASHRPITALFLAGLFCASVAGCSTSSASSAPTSPTDSAAAGSATSAGTSASPAAGLTICHEDNAQVELIPPSGNRILIDVLDPSLLSKPVTADDILLTTHGHPDHYSAAFVDSFPGKKITYEEASLDLNGVSISSIPAAHDEGQLIAPEGGSDYIFVIDIAGLRIGHFGDLGQDKITDEQMAKIGKIDIAFSQLANSFSSMDETNMKGINQMKQVKPLVFIPTHLSMETARLAGTMWPSTYSTKSVTITRSQLPAEMTVLFLGTRADSYGTLLKLNPSSW